MPPIVAEVYRREPTAGFERSAARRNVRVREDIYPQYAPDPIRYGDFYADGKPYEHGWSHVQQFITLNIAAILSQQEDDFRIGKMLFTNVMSTPAGLHAPLIERANIFRPESRAYGSLYTVDPRGTYQSPAMGPYLASSVAH